MQPPESTKAVEVFPPQNHVADIVVLATSKDEKGR